MRVRAPLALLVLPCLLMGGSLARAADDEAKAPPAQAKPTPADPSILTFKDVFGGGRKFTKPIPGWSWRPGHKQLVRLDVRKPKPTKQKPTKGAAGKGKKKGAAARPIVKSVLVTMDPETGAQEDLFDLSTLEPLVPAMERGEDGKPRKKKVRAMRAVGRAGARRFTWSKDGRQLCVVVRGDLVWVDLAAGTTRRLTHTRVPMADLNIAPDGKHVSFSRSNELWVVSTGGGAPRQLTTGASDTLLNGTLDWVYPEELGFRTAAWWSPDGKHIAYLQMDQSEVPTHRLPSLLGVRGEGRLMRYPRAGDPNPKVRVGVVPVGGGEPRWVAKAPSLHVLLRLDLVVGVRWPQSTEAGGLEAALPVVTLANRTQTRHVERGGAHGEAKALRGWLLAPRGRDVAPAVRIRRWQPDAVRWQRVDMRPGLPLAERFVDLTPPRVDASAVLHYDVSTGRCIYQGIPHGSHTQGLFLGGPGVEKLVRAPFARDPFLWTSASLDESGTYALVTTQNATTPARTVLARVRDGEPIREIGEARAKALDDLELAVPEYGQIPVPGGKEGQPLGHIRWRLWKPKDFDPSKRYGLIVNTYGGPGSRMVRNTYGRGPLAATFFAQRGFLVLQADGRGTSGQGGDWLHSVYGKLGVLEIDDQATAVQHILKRGYVDPERVGIWGWSYGGTMACNALTRRGDVFKAGVAVASVTDWRLYDSIYTERYMGLPKDNPEGYKQSSAITHAKTMTGQLLLMHGLGDDNVHAQNTVRLVEAFIQAKKTNYDVVLYPKRGHGIGGASHDVFKRLVDWFDRHIGAR
ncbi:MAG: prolyl oligopeptidase family serine peptidase [Planctomycetota bacterium]|nr:prolyl oligopeptidase family serine peptidase [Planctomycetota bacterium]